MMCLLFVHFHCLPLIGVIYLQFGSGPTELEVQIRFSLQDNREYVLDNPNMIRGVCVCGGGDKCTYINAYLAVVCGYWSYAFLTTFDLLF